MPSDNKTNKKKSTQKEPKDIISILQNRVDELGVNVEIERPELQFDHYTYFNTNPDVIGEHIFSGEHVIIHHPEHSDLQKLLHSTNDFPIKTWGRGSENGPIMTLASLADVSKALGVDLEHIIKQAQEEADRASRIESTSK